MESAFSCRLWSNVKKQDLTTNILIGSNDASTIKADVAGLVDAIGIPRRRAQLGIVSFGGAYFHPKTYHVKRPDGSQVAFIGSSNLTASGLALHVEAGIALDTREGDAPKALAEIAAAVDRWFAESRPGMTLVTGTSTIDDLVDAGILALAPPPKPAVVGGTGVASTKSPRPRLQRLFKLPTVKAPTSSPAAPTAVPPVVPPPARSVTSARLPSNSRAGFPSYLLFDPSATAATVDLSALTGTSLPNGSTGLIVQLNRDSARHFMGRSGTANISIPVATASTLRFGVSGIHGRPTCMFYLDMRYVGDKLKIDGGSKQISVMGYGFTAAETGHGDIRMLVPAAVRDLATAVKRAGKPVPTDGDLALLEWPNATYPKFRLTFIDTGSTLYVQASRIFQAAPASGSLVGHGACWLVPGLSPTW